MSSGGARKSRGAAGDGVDQGDLFGGSRPASVPTSADEAAPRIRVGELGPPPGAPEPPLTASPRASADESLPPAAPALPVPGGRVVLSVGELTRRLKGVLESTFTRVWVRGEVSGFRGPHARGHLYFSLKDADACLDVKIWASTAQRLKFKLRDGMELLVEGSLDVYGPQGRYSLIANRAEPVGEGALALAFQQLKEKLAAEGLMGERRTRAPRPLPFWPRRIGVVTSRTGAALRDFLRVLHQRNPKLQVLLCDARVQGEGSAGEVVRAIGRLSRAGVDVIVVTRGGGSIEDLWTFNEESVARAIWASPVPVVSAIGHEVDFTISDFVADHRAPTPTAAAALLAPVLDELVLQLGTARGRLRKAAERKLLEDRARLGRLHARLADPRRMLGQRRLALNGGLDRLVRALRQRLKLVREQQKGLVDRLGRMRPEARVGRDRQKLVALRTRLEQLMRQRLLRERRRLQALGREELLRRSPGRRLEDARRQLSVQRGRLSELVHRRLHSDRERFGKGVAGLQAMSPLAVMARGYAVVFRESDGALLRGAGEVAVGDAIRVTLAGQGSTRLSQCDTVTATVTDVRPGTGEAV